jgi:hypothetical protein
MRLEEAPTQYDATTNILTIILTNTSPAANGGFLTADAFSLGVAGTDDIQVTAFTGGFGLHRL